MNSNFEKPLQALLRAFPMLAPKPTIFKFDPKKPMPDSFACYTVTQLHDAYALGLRNGVGLVELTLKQDQRAHG